MLGLPTDRETIPMLLRYADLREAARDWKTFSSDAPFRVPIPSEEHLRSVRQLPIEADSPEHTDYRTLVEPFFLRSKQPSFVARVAAIVDRLLDRAAARPGDDFYSVLLRATFRGRPLTRAEMLGFANLMFAGGRDTVIHSVACAVGYLAERPEALEFLRADPGRTSTPARSSSASTCR